MACTSDERWPTTTILPQGSEVTPTSGTLCIRTGCSPFWWLDSASHEGEPLQSSVHGRILGSNSSFPEIYDRHTPGVGLALRVPKGVWKKRIFACVCQFGGALAHLICEGCEVLAGMVIIHIRLGGLPRAPTLTNNIGRTHAGRVQRPRSFATTPSKFPLTPPRAGGSPTRPSSAPERKTRMTGGYLQEKCS